ncbi:MAG: SpoIIE family protein phosphatase, partial [Bacteroidales bacterium]|nr:SpoIIE family protein phosphatase [Bacteroidales bacterium]
MKKLIGFLVVLFFVSEAGTAQIAHYSQFYSTPMTIAPSFAGLTEASRLSLNYRDQWPAIPGVFRTYSVGVDNYFNRAKSGVGLLFFRDVAGKGIPAALLMARLFASARFQLLTQPTLSSALSGLNAEMASSGLGHRFVTCIFVLLDPATNDVTIVNAGHMAPLLRTAARTIKVIAQEESGLPLGISPNEQFVETTIHLEK